jgi:hypothetical membrane protein
MGNTTLFKILSDIYPNLGLFGSLLIFTCCIVTALAYRGREGERYSIGNHYISELGEVGISRLAGVFNFGMIVGGILFTIMMLGFGLALNSGWSKLGMIAGVVAGIACTLVGVFPMNKIKPHTFMAMTYFRAGLVTVTLFTIAIFLQPAADRLVPLYVNIFGFLAFLAYFLFLVVVGRAERKRKREENVLETAEVKERPRFWITPFLEWMVFFTTLIWFLLVASIH